MNHAEPATASQRKAVFIDKDGTLIEDVPYNVDPELICFTPGAAEGLRLLHAAGYAFVVVSNQSGVDRGYFHEQALEAVEARLRSLMQHEGVSLAGFYYCPHDPQSAFAAAYASRCSCRKPQPGLILKAERELGIDSTGSWMVGDILDDVEAGRRAGCKTILLDNGHETQWQLSPQRVPHYFAADLLEAARIILASDQDPLRELQRTSSLGRLTL